MPRFLQGKDTLDRDPVRRLKIFMPSYPVEAQRRGIQGDVYVEFLVAGDDTNDCRESSTPCLPTRFDGVVRDSIMRSSFLPARVNGTPVSTTISTYYNFTVNNVSLSDYQGLETRVKTTLAKAEAGNTTAQLLYAMTISDCRSCIRPTTRRCRGSSRRRKPAPRTPSFKSGPDSCRAADVNAMRARVAISGWKSRPGRSADAPGHSRRAFIARPPHIRIRIRRPGMAGARCQARQQQCAAVLGGGSAASPPARRSRSGAGTGIGRQRHEGIP